MIPSTRAGFAKCRPVPPAGRLWLAAPSSPFDRTEFDNGVAELRRLGFEPVWDDRVFDRDGFVAGSAESRAASLMDGFTREDVDAVLAVRGGYGSIELLPHLDLDIIARSRRPFIGYSDTTSIHAWLNSAVPMTTIHGPMIDGRLARGEGAYDASSFLASLTTEPLREISTATVDVIVAGDATGPLVGGTLTQLVTSFGTPYEFQPPEGHVLFIEEVGERPYRLRRMLTQLRQSGRLAHASAVVIGQLPRCDEPGGTVTGKGVMADFFDGFPGPVIFGVASGHTTSPLVSLPFGVDARVSAHNRAVLDLTEAACG